MAQSWAPIDPVRRAIQLSSNTQQSCRLNYTNLVDLTQNQVAKSTSLQFSKAPIKLIQNPANSPDRSAAARLSEW